jgi:hypothetical protein
MAMWGGMTLLGMIVLGVIENPNLTPGDPKRCVS